MTIKQLSVFAENKPGAIAEITDALGAAGVDIRAMSIADTSDFGIFRLIVNHVDDAMKALADIGCIVSVTPIIAVMIPDNPGALNAILKLLSENNVNVEYMYAFVTMSKQNAYAVIRVEDNDSAVKLLTENNIPLVTESDIAKL